MLENIKLHDVVTVIKKYKDDEKSWRGARYTGVVIHIEKNRVDLLQADAATEDVDFSDQEYVIEIVPFSEVVFLNNIDKAITDAKKSVETAQSRLAGVEKWRKDFVLQISLLGKLYRLAKDTFNFYEKK